MQTKFSLEQLADPKIQEADSILRSCVHCGFCLATCPTYLLTGNELDSPRGRIVLIKDMLEKENIATATPHHIDRCLSCLSCMTTCPSGVDYMHLVDHARIHIEANYSRSFGQRVFRTLLVKILPYPSRFYWLGQAAQFARLFRSILPRKLTMLLGLLPSKLYTPKRRKTTIYPAQGAAKGRVALMLGCVQDVLRPNIHDATIRLLTHQGFEVVTLDRAQCCGALAHHLGKAPQAEVMARENIERLCTLHQRYPFDYVVTTASGCGTMVKDYGHIFQNIRAAAETAKFISSRYRDVSELLIDLPASDRSAPLFTVTYQAPCSLYHGQKTPDLPARLLARLGFKVIPAAESYLCCGSAGTYNLLQPALSQELRKRKLENLLATGADVIATANIGCLAQLSDGSGIPVYHWIEMADWVIDKARYNSMQNREFPVLSSHS